MRLEGRLRASGAHLRMLLSRAVSQGTQEYFTKRSSNKDMQVSEAGQDRSLASSSKEHCTFSETQPLHEGVQLPQGIENPGLVFQGLA